MARILASLANRGVRVLVSTHSDYFLRELNNLIMLAQDDGQLSKDFGYQPEEVLKADSVGVFLFEAEDEGAVSVRPIPVEPTGFEVHTIDREINRLNATAQQIFMSLFGNRL